MGYAHRITFWFKTTRRAFCFCCWEEKDGISTLLQTDPRKTRPKGKLIFWGQHEHFSRWCQQWFHRRTYTWRDPNKPRGWYTWTLRLENRCSSLTSHIRVQVADLRLCLHLAALPYTPGPPPQSQVSPQLVSINNSLFSRLVYMENFRARAPYKNQNCLQ